MMRLNLQQFASSADYWRKREERNLKSNLKQEAEYDKEIERIYKDMLDAAQKEIDAFSASMPTNTCRSQEKGLTA